MDLKRMDADELGREYERRVEAVTEAWLEIKRRMERIQDEFPTSGYDDYADVDHLLDYGALRAGEVAETLVEMTEALDEQRQRWQAEDERGYLYSYWASERGV